MRDYSKISGAFWTGDTGKRLRGDMQAQIVALYLMTSPHANMIGVFYCPVIYIAHDTGIPFEGALEGLKKLCEGGFCAYDEASEMVWVHEMAKFQIGDELKPTDNRVKDLHKQFENIAEGRIKQGFFARYKDAFLLPEYTGNNKPLRSPSEAPPKPETGAETETGAGAGAGVMSPTASRSASNGTRLPADWQLPRKWGEWAMTERPELKPDDIRKLADKFKDHWLANANRKEGRKANWEATWKNWVRNEPNFSRESFKTAGQRRNENTDAAALEFLNRSKGNVIEGEFAHAGN